MFCKAQSETRNDHQRERGKQVLVSLPARIARVPLVTEITHCIEVVSADEGERKARINLVKQRHFCRESNGFALQFRHATITTPHLVTPKCRL